jgi:NNP family nitrate/nitrite transporter-like MFS transporter
MVSGPRLNLFSLQGKTGVLHSTWFAFFVSFLVWFNHAPLMATVRDALDLSSQQVATLLTLNVALTIPARIVIGMLVDRFGPRIMYSLLLAISSLLCFAYAMANSFEALALTRFLLGFAGAGFVIGIRMIGEWFPAREVGLAQGIYGGWGNFGSAAGALTLPTVALWFGGDEGWRYAIALTGIIALVYSFIYYRAVRNTPKGSTYFRPQRTGGMEITSRLDLLLYLLMKVPLVAALALLIWQLGPSQLGLLDVGPTNAFYVGCVLVYLQSTRGGNPPLFVQSGCRAGRGLSRDFRVGVGGRVHAAPVFPGHLRNLPGHCWIAGFELRIHEPRGAPQRRSHIGSLRPQDVARGIARRFDARLSVDVPDQ